MKFFLITSFMKKAPATSISIITSIFIILTLLSSWSAAGGDAWFLFSIYVSLLALYLTTIGWQIHKANSFSGLDAKPVIVFASSILMISFFCALSKLPFLAIPWRADAWLYQTDIALFGFGAHHIEMLSNLSPLWLIELSALIYSAFIYGLFAFIIYISKYPCNLIRSRFVFGLVLIYSIGFLGYILLPAYGPIIELDRSISGISGGFIYKSMVESLNLIGGPYGAFPSLHLAITCFIGLFIKEIRPNLAKFVWIYLVAMAITTIILRYHYIVDLVVGVVLGYLCFYLVSNKTSSKVISKDEV